jgi:putative tricarboxylic transport membrane protein
MLAFALLGFVFARADIPKAPLVLAVILGPILEINMRRMLQLNDGDIGSSIVTLATSPVAAPILLVTIGLFLTPVVRKLLARRRSRIDANAPTTTTPEGK